MPVFRKKKTSYTYLARVTILRGESSLGYVGYIRLLPLFCPTLQAFFDISPYGRHIALEVSEDGSVGTTVCDPLTIVTLRVVPLDSRGASPCMCISL